MNRISKIKEELRMHGVGSINLIVLDITLTQHIGVYNLKEDSFTNYHTGEAIECPVLYDRLPTFSEKTFDDEVEILYGDTNLSNSEIKL